MIRWSLIRSVGELAVLTRASYLLLAIVPLLSAVWPAVRTAVSGVNQYAESSARELRDSAKELRTQIELLEGRVRDLEANTPGVLILDSRSKEEIKRIAVALIGKLDAANARLEPLASLKFRNLPGPDLPQTLTLGFFAALCIALGHFVYEARAHEIVRNFSQKDFLLNEQEKFSKFPTDRRLEIARTNLSDAEEPPTEPLELIARAAAKHYNELDKRNSGSAIVAGVFYGAGLLMIVEITRLQVLAVLQARGWPA